MFSQFARRWTANLFNNPFVYELFQRAVLTSRERKQIEELVASLKGKILDFGCGNGKLAKYFDKEMYLGIDPISSCIDVARYRHPNHAFVVGTNEILSQFTRGQFEAVISWGVLHHLDDETLSKSLQGIREILSPGGSFIALEPVRDSIEGLTIRDKVMSFDRGAYIREWEDYRNLLLNFGFNDVRVTIRKDLVRIPYRQVLIIAQI
jgi:2-polyprenyl-3-methyl-5-hydroxy-6-metoxy-1,4-benzoquinol methylase